MHACVPWEMCFEIPRRPRLPRKQTHRLTPSRDHRRFAVSADPYEEMSTDEVVHKKQVLIEIDMDQFEVRFAPATAAPK